MSDAAVVGWHGEIGFEVVLWVSKSLELRLDRRIWKQTEKEKRKG